MRHAVTPTVLFRLRIAAAGGGRVDSITLQTQLRILVSWRRYDEAERERLAGLLGAPAEQGRSAGSLHWTNASVGVPRFDGEALVDLPVGLTYDFEVATAQYFHALEGGDVPLELLFSGTVFYTGPSGRLQTSMIPWEKEAKTSLPVEVWREAMDAHFPDSAWLRLRRRTFDRLHDYRVRHALPSWEDAVEALLRGRGV